VTKRNRESTAAKGKAPIPDVLHQSIGLNDERRWEKYYPNNNKRARHLVMSHRDELIGRGALVRVGKELVVILPAYLRWLTDQGPRVAGYSIAPNAPEHAPKRFGRDSAAAAGQ
jgi:hypothetical protein